MTAIAAPALERETPIPVAPARAEASRESIVAIALRDISPDPQQARDEGADDELAASIKEAGVLQPVVVRRALVGRGDTGKTPWILVDGERRYRGAKVAGLERIPARVATDVDDVGDRLLHQVLFNDGKRLKPMEEARAWKRILDAKGWSLLELAQQLGRPKSTVSDRLAVLSAPAPFQPLFNNGVLTPAAAPIVREFRDVPESILKDAVKELSGNWHWQTYVNAGAAIPVERVRRGLEDSLTASWNGKLRRIDKTLAPEYSGAVATIKGERYATDVKAYDALVAKRAEERREKNGTSASDQRWQRENAAREKKRREATEKKRRLRRAQFDAITAKLPTAIDGDAALFVITALLREMQQLSHSAACKALGIELPKTIGSTGRYDTHRKAIIGHAAMLTAKDRVRMLLQLAMAGDLQVSEWEQGPAERLTAAAKLVKIDLAKVKVAGAEKPAKKTARARSR